MRKLPILNSLFKVTFSVYPFLEATRKNKINIKFTLKQVSSENLRCEKLILT